MELGELCNVFLSVIFLRLPPWTHFFLQALLNTVNLLNTVSFLSIHAKDFAVRPSSNVVLTGSPRPQKQGMDFLLLTHREGQGILPPQPSSPTTLVSKSQSQSHFLLQSYLHIFWTGFAHEWAFRATALSTLGSTFSLIGFRGDTAAFWLQSRTSPSFSTTLNFFTLSCLPGSHTHIMHVPSGRKLMNCPFQNCMYSILKAFVQFTFVEAGGWKYGCAGSNPIQFLPTRADDSITSPSYR